METDPKPQLQIGDVLRVLLTIIALSRLCYGYFSSAKSFFSTPNIIFHWIRILRRNVFLKLSEKGILNKNKENQKPKGQYFTT